MTANDSRGAFVGRAPELRMFRSMVDALVAGRGGSLVFTGPAGIGKSALVRSACLEARTTLKTTEDGAVSTVTAVNAERRWPYSGLHLMLSGVTGMLPTDHRDKFDAATADFLAGLRSDSNSYDAAMRLLSLLSFAGCPVLVVIDDAHQLDARSQDVIGFVARRLRSMPVSLVMVADSTQRSAPLLEGLSTIRLAELGPEDAIDLLLSAHDDMVESVAAAVCRLVGGNPRALLDVAARMPPEQREGLVALDRYAPESAVLRDLVLPGLPTLSDEQRFALLVASVSADGRLGPVMAALGQGEVTEWLVRVHLSASDASFRLRAPAVASVVWRHAGMAERSRAHELLADEYAKQGCSEQVLWHRAAARIDRDDELAAALRQASADLVERGEFERSVAFARESVRLTASDAERADRLLASGGFAFLAGRFDDAIHVSRERSRVDMTMTQRAELALLETRARILADRLVPTDLVTYYTERLAEADPDRAAQFWLAAASGFADRMELSEAADYLARAEACLPDVTETTHGSYRRTAAWVASLSGELDRAAELIDADAKASDVLAEPERCVRHAMVLTRLERFDEARRLLQTVTDHRRFGDSPAALGSAYAAAAIMEVRAGRLIAADDAASAWRRVLGTSRAQRGIVPMHMVQAYALMGDAEAAQRCHAEVQASARRSSDWWVTAMAQAGAGAMYLLCNQPDEAMSALERARDRALACADPSLLAAEPDFIEACVRRGEHERARSALAAYEVRVDRVPTAWARHTLARCRALVAADEPSLELFAVAVQEQQDVVSPAELARTQLCYGERLRRLGRRTDAAEWLNRAIVVAGECSAAGVAARAGEELGSSARGGGSAGAAAGGAPERRDDLSALTESEYRVAALAAEGRRNREIAADLYVSVRTVEAHLGRVFRKLGVRSRAELTGVVVGGRAATLG